MEQQKIELLSQQLIEEKERLESLIERTKKHLYRREEPYSADFAEQVVEVENNEVVERLDEDAKIDLANIRKALIRIEEGNYGICTECSNDITVARLEAIPQAELCIDCADIAP
jgi:RNA polymerase-binding transcription factor